MEIQIETNSLRLLDLDVTEEQTDLILDILTKERLLGYEEGLKLGLARGLEEGINISRSVVDIIKGN